MNRKLYWSLTFVWPCILNMKWRVRPTRCNKLWLINNPLAPHVSGIIMLIFRSARPYITAYGFQHLMCWLVSWEARKQTVCTVHTVCWKPYAVTYGLALLKMGIRMPETCWANGLLINHNLLHLVGLTRHFTLLKSILSWCTASLYSHFFLGYFVNAEYVISS